MEDLLIKISDLLGMSVDSLISYYPELRSQLVWYGILDTIALTMIISLMVTPFILLFVYIVVDMNDYYYWGKNLNKELLVNIIKGLAPLVITLIIAHSLKFILATDLMMLNHLIN